MRIIEKVFKALADKNRLRVLKLLEQKHMCVCELSFILDITQPSVSRHLKKLKSAGLIDSEKQGFWTNYFIKGSNEYAVCILKTLKNWLKDDEIIKKDLKKVKTIDRKKICSTS